MVASVRAFLPDCLIAKVDGPGEVDLPGIFGKCWPPIFVNFHIFLSCFHSFDVQLVG